MRACCVGMALERRWRRRRVPASDDHHVDASRPSAPGAPALRHLCQRAAGGGAPAPGPPCAPSPLPRSPSDLSTCLQDLEALVESSEEQEAAPRRRGKAPAGRRQRKPQSEDEEGEESKDSEAEPRPRKRGRKQAAAAEESEDGEGSDEDSSEEEEAAAAPTRAARRQPRFVPPPPREPRTRSDMLSLLFACPALIGEGRSGWGWAVDWVLPPPGAAGVAFLPALRSLPFWLPDQSGCQLLLYRTPSTTTPLPPSSPTYTHLHTDALLEPDGLRPVTLVARDAAHLASALGARAPDMADLWCQLARRVDPRLAASGAAVALPQGRLWVLSWLGGGDMVPACLLPWVA